MAEAFGTAMVSNLVVFSGSWLVFIIHRKDANEGYADCGMRLRGGCIGTLLCKYHLSAHLRLLSWNTGRC